MVPSVRARKLENSVWYFVKGYLLRPDLAVQELQAKQAAAGGRVREVGDKIKRLEERLGGRAKARMRVLDLAGKDFFRDDEIRQELQHIEDAARDDERELMELRQISTATEGEALPYDWAGRMLDGNLRKKLLKDNLTFAEKLKFVETLVEEITVKLVEGKAEPEIRVKFRFSPDYTRAKEWGRASSLASRYTGTRADNNCNRYETATPDAWDV